MSENRKYYWLKLKRDFFKRHDIRIIEEMENGKDYILFYLKMLLESIDHEGELRFSDTIPYNEKMLSVITNTNIDIVRSAMKVFIDLKMVEIFDDNTIYMTEVLKLTGSETAGAERVRKHRNRNKMLHCNTDETKCNTEIEKEIEIELDTEIEIDSNGLPTYPPPPKEEKPPKPVRHKYGEYKNVLLTDEDLSKLQSEFSDWEERIERLSCYIAQSGKSYKSHLATIRNWARKDKEKAPQKGTMDRSYEWYEIAQEMEEETRGE